MINNTEKLSSKKKIQQLRKTIKKGAHILQQQELALPTTTIQNKPVITFVLEKPVLVPHKGVLLEQEWHSKFISKKLRRDPQQFRPDIVHQSLLTLMDSPLNKSGCMRVLINCEGGPLIEVDSETKIPRTYKRFTGMMAKLVEKGIIKFEDKALLRTLRGNVTANVNENSYVIGTSYKGVAVQDLKGHLEQKMAKQPIVVVVGAVAVGQPLLECPYVDECIQVSRYQLSTSNTLSKLIDCFEQLYNTL